MRTSNKYRLCSFGAMQCLLLLRVRAGTPADDPSSYAVPQSPAAAIVGSSADISRPTSPQAAGTSLLSEVQSDSIGAGFSLVYVPYQWINANSGRPLKANQIIADPLQSFLYRAELSAAEISGVSNGTTASGGKATASNVGLGFRDEFFDHGDIRFDQHWNDTEETKAEDPKFTPAMLKSDISDWKDQNWNASALGFGGAMNLTSTSSQYSTLKYDGGEVWLVDSAPLFVKYLQLLGQATYRFHQLIVTKGVESHQDVSNIGAQIRFGQSKNGWDGYTQFTEAWTRPDSGKTTGKPVVGLGAEVKVNWFGGFWLQLGWASNNLTSGSSLFSTSVRYAFAAKPAN